MHGLIVAVFSWLVSARRNNYPQRKDMSHTRAVWYHTARTAAHSHGAVDKTA